MYTKTRAPNFMERLTNKKATEQDIADQSISILFQTVACMYPLEAFPVSVVNNSRTMGFCMLRYGLNWKLRELIRIDGAINNLLLVDPVVGGLLPGVELLRLEPESDLLLGRLDGVGAVADVAADVLWEKKIISDAVSEGFGSSMAGI